MRRKFRPYFVDVDEKGVEHNKPLKWLYDVLSVIVTVNESVPTKPGSGT